MSEEIAQAAADLAYVDRLRERLNHATMEAQDAIEGLRRERDDARAALRAMEAHTATELNTIKALLIEMRRYFISHNCPTGECVAWTTLKALFGVGQRDEDDEAWMVAYTEEPFTLHRLSGERRRRNRE